MEPSSWERSFPFHQQMSLGSLCTLSQRSTPNLCVKQRMKKAQRKEASSIVVHQN